MHFITPNIQMQLSEVIRDVPSSTCVVRFLVLGGKQPSLAVISLSNGVSMGVRLSDSFVLDRNLTVVIIASPAGYDEFIAACPTDAQAQIEAYLISRGLIPLGVV